MYRNLRQPVTPDEIANGRKATVEDLHNFYVAEERRRERLLRGGAVIAVILIVLLIVWVSWRS